jgi:hypothetical protein
MILVMSEATYTFFACIDKPDWNRIRVDRNVWISDEEAV